MIRVGYIFKVDIDALKVVHQDPLPQFEDDVGLNRGIVEQNMDALRVEIAHLRVAEHRHDVEVVFARDFQHVIVGWNQRRVPVMKVETPRIFLQVDP